MNIPKLSNETVTKANEVFALVVKSKEKGKEGVKGEKYIGIADFTLYSQAEAFFTKEGALKILQGKADLHCQKASAAAKDLADYSRLVVADSMRAENGMKYFARAKELKEWLAAGKENLGDDDEIVMTAERRAILTEEKAIALAKAVELMS